MIRLSAVRIHGVRYVLHPDVTARLILRVSYLVSILVQVASVILILCSVDMWTGVIGFEKHIHKEGASFLDGI